MKKSVSIVCLIIALCLFLAGCKSEEYEKAVVFQDAGAYEAAAEIYRELGNYEDSVARLAQCETAIAEIEAYNAAVTRYEAAKSSLDEKNATLDAAMLASQELIDSGDPLDYSLVTALEDSIENAENSKLVIHAMPEETDSILAICEEMEAVDYSDILSTMADDQTALEQSIALFQLVNNPSEEYILECLGRVPGITGAAAVTEENDPNNKLHKDGSYTAAIYFCHEYISATVYEGDAVIGRKTDGGGCIEVFANVEDAVKRDSYLELFDGTILDSGSHTIVGTIVVRTSCKLTASQQDEIEAKIIEELLSAG